MRRLLLLGLSALGALALAGCMTPPPDLDLSLTRPTAQGRYVVTLEPPAKAAAINQIHTWQVKVASPSGAPVTDARIAVDGGMPQHGHGLPTRPQVRREPGDGRYLIEGMKFSMTGWWEIKLAIDGAAGSDKVTFNTVVSEAPAPRAGGDGWSDQEEKVLASLSVSRLPPMPADPSNAVDRLPAAAALGKRLFNDSRFSSNGAVSCASCHAPDKQFQDGLAVGRGVGTGSRRAMPLMAAGHSPWLFWDGRKDSLWSQALGPLEDAAEHGGNRTRYARVVQANYGADYEALFGKLPDLSQLPADAGPLGNGAERAAWDALEPARRQEVSRVFANMGKAIAAYERTIGYGPSRFDRYADALAAGDKAPQQLLARQEIEGLRLFIGKGQCVSCHNGPLLSDQHFHNTGVPPLDPSRPDRGRAAATAKVQKDEFNCLGPFSDAKRDACQELAFMVLQDKSLEAAFKTPGLRNVALRPPYMHAGQFSQLEQVVGHYVKAPPAVLGHSELAHGEKGHSERKPIQLSEHEIRDVAAFLRALSGPVVEQAAGSSGPTPRR